MRRGARGFGHDGGACVASSRRVAREIPTLRETMSRSYTGTEIAVIGMAGHYPRSGSVSDFWRHLREGRELVTFFDREDLLASGVDAQLLDDPRYVKAAAYLEDMECFDAAFFGVAPREAALMDPQHRHFLECAWEALEDAGYDPQRCPSRVGVYAGAAMDTYLLYNLMRNPVARATDVLQIQLGNDKDYLPTRVSYKLDLRGPSMLVQSACSSSLVATHVATQALLDEECEIALVGGAAVLVHTRHGYLHKEGGVASSDGHCRSFDLAADGTIFGSGVGVVALKLLSRALEDGDHIEAIILGTAINNDGNMKVGFGAPSVEGLSEVIAEAIANAGVDTETIGYVEAHGMGTRLGDPMELQGLTSAFGLGSSARQLCPIGSVKSNVGHLDAASGVTALIKTCLCVREGVVPPTLHFRRPNPAFDLASTPFFVNDRLREMDRRGAPRRAAVYSMAIGGTNACVVVEEPPPAAPTPRAEPFQLFVLSARTEAALERATANLAEHLRRHPDTNLADAAFTLQAGRQHFEHRRFAVGRDTEDMARLLSEPKSLPRQGLLTERPSLAFMFPGQGAQAGGMAAQVYEREEGFREPFDACVERIRTISGIDLHPLLVSAWRQEHDDQLRRTEVAQPALFAVEYSLAKLLERWGARPSIMIGHSIGEYVAACLADVFTLDDALSIVCERGRLMARLPAGGMLAIQRSVDEVREWLGPSLSIATINAPTQCVVSGPLDAVASLEQQLRARSIPCRRLRTSHAFHSAMMDPVVEELVEVVRRGAPKAPRLPFVSNLSGRLIRDEEATDPSYWGRHLRGTVNFSRGIEEILRLGNHALVEVGPGSTLVTLALRHAPTGAAPLAVPTLSHAQVRDADASTLLSTLGQLWQAGVAIDWEGMHAGKRRRRVSLPTYSFERERHWLEPAEDGMARSSRDQAPGGSSRAADVVVGPKPEICVPIEPPSDDVEGTIAAMFGALLGIAPVGVHDDFFVLGGDSMVGIQLLSSLHEVFGVDLSARAVFEHRTAAQLAALVRERGTTTRPPLTRAMCREDLPLSFAQQRLWVLSESEAEDISYNLPFAMRILGDLSSETLRRAFEEVLRRHEVLRTTIEARDGVAVQRIQPATPWLLPVVDLSDLTAPAREAELERRVLELAKLPFDLAHGPLLRTVLLRLGDTEQVLFVCMHHIATDAWSMGVLIHEICTLYDVLGRGDASPLAELTIQYADYAVWQRGWLEGELLDEQASYWKGRLANLQSLELPTDRPRPLAPSRGVGSIPLRVSGELLEELRTLGRGQGATLFMVLVAALQALLHRLSGQDDVTVGTPIAGRQRRELEGLIGLFVNTLVLRADLSDDPTFVEFLEQVRETTLGAHAHHDIPFERLVEELAPARDTSRHPLFQVMFTLQNAPHRDVHIEGLEVSLIPIESGAAKFDLLLMVGEEEGELRGTLEYATDLFDRDTAQKMVERLSMLLEAIVAQPDVRIGALSILTAEERAAIARCNDTASRYPQDACVHHLFEARVDSTPAAVAVVDGSEQMTYAELDRAAERVARRLRAMGAGPEVRVGLCLRRSPHLLVAMLGVIKAGAAYVPLDPSYPRARIEYIFADSGARILVVESALADGVGVPASSRLIIDELNDGTATESTQRLAAEVRADNLAYVMYTSGSTGKPKGVMVHHRGLVNYLSWAMGAYPTGAGAPVHSSIGFDLTITSIFLPLLTGRAVVMVSEQNTIEALVGLMQERPGFGLVKITPAHLGLLERLLPPECISGSTRSFVVGGEALKWEQISFLRRHAPEVQIVNEYGPTETVVGCCTFEIGGDMGSAVEGAPVVPIGRPIANTQLYVVDRGLGLQPPGVTGELLVGGDGVTRGYQGRPGMTAERFVPDPFSGSPGARMYRTGDLARWRADGSLEFLGRTDQQVKLRGHRIELAEIEAALASFPGVREAAVVLRGDAAAGEHLAAYLVLAGGQPTPVEAIREHLSSDLPGYMIPTSFIVLEALPLLLSGKVDRKALCALEEDEHQRAKSYEAPRSRVEQQLAAIWSEVLRLEHVGIHDNFFEIGGDSILNIQAVARARKAGIELSPELVFKYPTIASLRDVVGSLPGPHAAEQEDATGVMRLLPIHRQFLEGEPEAPHHFTQALLFEICEGLDGDTLERAIDALVTHHDALRLRFTRVGDAWQAHFGDARSAWIFVREDLGALPVASRRSRLEARAAELQASLSLGDGPMLVAAWFGLGAELGDRLLLAAHHFVVDGVSWRVLLEDLEHVHAKAVLGEPIVLPAKTTSYQRWAERLSEHARSESMVRRLDAWTHHLERDLPRLPRDFAVPDEANTVASGVLVTATLSRDETQALLQRVPQAYHTQISDVLITALAQTIAAWTREAGVYLEIEGHGREALFDDVDLSRTVGWFTILAPVFLEIDAGAGPEQALKSVKEQLRRFPHHGMGHGLLRHLGPDDTRHTLARVPRPEVVFNYLGQLDLTLEESSLLRPAKESAGPTRDGGARRSHVLDIDGMVIEGRLQVSLTFSEALHERETIERLAAEFRRRLVGLIHHCSSPDAYGRTPSDFPLIEIEQAALDRLIGSERNVEDMYRLSPMQQGMLYHSLKEPSSGMYMEQLHAVLDGVERAELLMDAWRGLLETEPMLRTSFHWDGLAEPVQVVHRRVEYPVSSQDWRALSEAEQQERLAAYLLDDRRRGFDFERAPLWRLLIARLGSQRYAFIWTHHHILLDGWCLSLILKDLFAFYHSARSGEPPRLERRGQFRDYIGWLSARDLQVMESHWRGRLQGFEETTPLFLEHRADASMVGAHRRVETKLSGAETEALVQAARRHRLTLSTIVHGAWAILLSRRSGRSEVVFGSTIAGRPPELPNVETMVGLFINTLPLRVEVREDEPLIPWLGGLMTQQAELRANGAIPLWQVQSLGQSSSRGALFDSIVVFENYPMDEAIMRGPEGVRVEGVRLVEQTNYPLTAAAAPGSELTLQIGFDTSRVSKETASRILGHWKALLEGASRRLSGTIGDLSLLGTDESQRLLTEWSTTSTEALENEGVHRLVEAWASKRPELTALVFSGQQVTYGELNRRANRLAHHLRMLGAGPEVKVGLHAERSIELVVGLLGILKSGAAYVPLEPALPMERLSHLLQDAAIALVVAQESLSDELPATDAYVVMLDEEVSVAAHGSEHDLAGGADGRNAAYVIYTSGSSGTPKGVVLEHRGIRNLALAQGRAFALREGSRVLQFARLGFDVATGEILTTLSAGGTLFMAPPDELVPGAGLVELLERHAIELVMLTPSALSLLEPTALPKLRTLVVGGEPCSSSLVERWATGRAFFNVYGPTEATVTTTIGRCIDGGEPSIGRPITNAQVYVLDRRMVPSPVGVPGELFIGGAGVARGYSSRPTLTAATFVPDPFSSAPGARLYRTGDLVRWRDDGTLEFLGRVDRQVKVRGHRIEPGEIEAALMQHPSVSQAAVIVREDAPGEKRLVAYVVASGAEPVEGADLRSYLEGKLPEYMVPALHIPLPALPLSPSGKVNRRALPAPEAFLGARETAKEQPRTPIERALGEIIRQVLRVQDLGLHDNFFDLGGDSILSIQVAARASQSGLRVTPRQIFQHPTIAELAQVVSFGADGVEAEQGVVSGEMPLLPIHRHWLELLPTDRSHFAWTLLLEVLTSIDVAVLEQALGAVVEHHDALRLRLVEGRAVHAEEPAAVRVEIVDLSDIDEHAQRAVIDAKTTEIEEGLDVEQGPILRAVWFERGDLSPPLLLLVLHHLVVDGVSWRILTEDLASAYAKLVAGEPASLSPKTTSYRAWGERLAAWARTPAAREQLEYWASRPTHHAKPLPRDHTADMAQNTVASAEFVELELSAEETDALLTRVPPIYRTQINDVLLTAVGGALAAWVGSSTVSILLEGHGREQLVEGVDLSRTVGWFTSIFPVTLEIDAASEPAAALKSVKEQMRRVPERGIGYGALRYLGDEDTTRELSEKAEPEVEFNYMGQIAGSDLFRMFRSKVPVQPGSNRRPYVLGVGAMVVEGRMKVMFSFSRALHQRSTIERLARGCLERLRRLIEHCLSPDAGGFTPTDFPLAGLGQVDLDRVLGSARNVEDVFRLSPMQQGMLFHALKDPGSGTYVEQLHCVLDGLEHPDAFEQAWRQLVDAEPTLRTSFYWEGLSSPVQVVWRDVELPLTCEDLRGIPRDACRDQLASYIESDRLRDFDPTQAPLLRLQLTRLGPERYAFVWTHHHILMDGWCFPLLLEDLFARYEALCRGVAAPSSRRGRFRDYIAWLDRQDMAPMKSYWSELLRGFREPTRLPLGCCEPSPEGSSYRRLRATLSTRSTAALGEQARAHHLTLSTLVHGAYAIVLSRMSGDAEVLFGSTMSGRPPELPDIETTIGLFINTLPLRVGVGGDELLLPWLGRLMEQQADARQNGAIPLWTVQGLAETPRGTPLFDTIVVFENYPIDSAVREGPHGISVESVEIVEQTSYPLTAVAVPGEEMSLFVSYDASQISDEVASRMLLHWKTLLEGMAADLEGTVGLLPLVPEDELQRVVVGWNDTASEYSRGACVHELFEAQAAKTPDAVAVVAGDARLSYAELDERAGRLAQRLAHRGVGPEVLVGIFVERSLDMAIAVLAILKAGGAYLPLDPEHPAERLEFMLGDAAVPLVLTQASMCERLPPTAVEVLVLDREAEARASYPPGELQPGVGPMNVAYGMYTSGTTGKPKCVLVSHRNAVNLLGWSERFLDGFGDWSLPVVAGFAFDPSFWQMFTPWSVGKAAWIIDMPSTIGAGATVDRLSVEGKCVLNCVPSVWNAMLESIEQGETSASPGLAALLLGGDHVEPALVRRTRAVMPELEIWNVYGPTETTVNATVGRVSSPDAISIGRPIANTRAYVLDHSGSPVPVGVPGELYIGGDGVCRGYRQRPALTAERFVPDPWGTQPGARLYRTGDRARWLTDGNLEFLGRVDRQVKLRGVRVELGELESVIGQHPAVREVVVTARERTPPVTRLLAHLVASDGVEAPRSSELREFLRGRLPEPMIPSDFVWLESLPRVTSGKVDAAALPPPTSSPEMLSPRTGVAELLAMLFAEVLDGEPTQMHGDFFALGGHSLLATQLVSRIRTTLGVELPVRAIFDAPTVSELAARVEWAQREQLPLPPPLERAPRDAALPLSFSQQRLWFLQELQPKSAAYNMPLALDLDGPLDVEALRGSFEVLVRRHEVLRTTYTESEGIPIQHVHPPVAWDIPMEDLREWPRSRQEVMVRSQCIEELDRPFDLREGPLLRTRLLRLGDESFVLLCTMHHIASDGWSTAVLTRELSTLYAELSCGREPSLPPLAIQYADYAIWQRSWLSGAVLDAHLAYWKERLAGAPPAIDLRIDRPRPPVRSHRGAALPVSIGSELSTELHALCRRERVTMFMTLLAAFQTLLYRYTGQEDLVIGSPIANRTRAETEGLIGFFVNTLVLRTTLSGQWTFLELLEHVREVTLGAYAHQELPFEYLVEELSPARDLSRSPLFQVAFVLQNTPSSPPRASDLSIRPRTIESTMTKFDLTLFVTEIDGVVEATLEYSTDLFDEETIARMAGHFVVLLEGIVAEPSTRLEALPLLRPAERDRLLVEWNDTRRPLGEGCVHQRFEAQASRTPDAVVAELGEARLTYQELDRRANHLAHLLRARGVRPEVSVGLFVERSFELLIGLLGILKAGGTYVPLDPSHPKERLRFMLEDTGTRHLVAQRHLLGVLPEATVEVVCVDGAALLVNASDDRGPCSDARADNAAYIMYTSGSTGRPKGVVVTHRGLCNYLDWCTSEYDVAGGAGAPVHSSVAFDLGVTSLFAPLLAGRKVVIIPQDGDLEGMSRALRKSSGFSLVKITPLHLELLSQILSAHEARAGTKALVVGGEALSWEQISFLGEHAPEVRVINEYGPTETVVGCCTYEATGGGARSGPVPIGRPIANMRLHVLDTNLEPVPVGVPGELYIGGVGVSRGYVGRPAETAECFLPDPFCSDEPGARLYRTGDLGRRMPTGDIEFLGRRDHQVKIRGYRVELGEIEGVVRQHPVVRDAVVVLRENSPGDARIVAYLVPRVTQEGGADTHGDPGELGALREYLSARLPDYMIPSALVVLDQLPQTSSGKVDRRALPEPGTGAGTGRGEPPRTPMEVIVARIWCDVLRVDEVGRDENFFEIGGHSLLATRVVAHIRAALGVEVPLLALFEAPTVMGLAERIETLEAQRGGPSSDPTEVDEGEL